MTDELMTDELPEGWSTVPLGQCVDVLDGMRVPVNSEERAKRPGDVPYYGATGQVGWIDDFIFNEALVLLGEDGAPFLDMFREHAYLIRGKSWVNNHAHVLRAIAGLTSNEYIKYALDGFDFHGYVNGTTRLKLTKGAMVTIPVRLPPAVEQRRVVTKIEGVLAEVNASRQHLGNVSAILNRFRRQSVLAAAYSGDLTREWRVGTTCRWPWREVTVGEVGEVLGGKRLPKGHEYADTATKHPYIRVVDFDNASVRLSDLKYLRPDTAQRLWRYTISKNDVYISIAGSIGKVGTVPAELDGANLTENAAKLTKLKGVTPQFLSVVLNSPALQSAIADETKATGQPKLALFRIENLVVPQPQVAEQDEIVRRVDALFALADTIEKQVAAATARADKLTQSILAKAFRGELVPTEAELARHEGRDYEPASVLLERIKQNALPRRHARGTNKGGRH